MRDFAKLDILLRAFFILACVSLAGLLVQFGLFSLEDPLPQAFTNKDFANYWMAGRLVLGGSAVDLFGPQPGYFRHLVDVFGQDYPWHNWSYPPHYLLLVWWTGFFSYPVAFALFMIVTLGPFIWACRAFVGRINPYLAAMIAPFVVYNVWAGQNGFLTGALILGGLALRAERPLIAGLFIGLLTVKPQLGFLFPVLLLLERRWLVLLSAAFTTIVLVAMSAALFGNGAWSGYLTEVIPYQSQVMQNLDGSFLLMLTSAYGGLRNWGLDYSQAILGHVSVAGPLFLATLYGLAVARNDQDRAILLVLGTFVITPYALIYDMGPVAAAAALMAVRSGSGDPRRAPYRYLLSALAVLPLCAMSLARVGLPVMPLGLCAVFALAWLRTCDLVKISQVKPRV